MTNLIEKQLILFLQSIAFVLSLDTYRSSFASFEIFIIFLIFASLEQIVSNKSLLYATFYGLAFLKQNNILGPLNLLLIFGIDIKNEFLKICNEILMNYSKYWLIVISISVVPFIQWILILYGETNIRRKLFHILALIIFFHKDKNIISLAEYINYGFLAFATWNNLSKKLFSRFLSKKDYGQGIFSHVFLMAACVYPSYYLNITEYRKNLITICIMDAFASMAGSLRLSKNKSIFGFLMGLFAAFLAEKLLLETIDVRYHIVMAILEFITPWNDNIMLPLGSVLYFKLNIKK